MSRAITQVQLLGAAAVSALAGEAWAQERDESRAVVGLSAIHAPAYQGADKYRSLPFPVIDLSYGRFFLSGRAGAGAKLIDGDIVDVSAGVTYMPGYRRRDAPVGIGRLSGGAGARASAETRLGRAVLSLSATRALTGDVDGTLAEAGLAMPIRASQRVMLIPRVSTTWADAAYNRAYFGVSAAQSAASGLPAFRPGGGVKDVAASLTASYRLSGRISLGATGVVTTLTGDAKRSPIVVHATQPAAFLSVSYAF